jgi:ABC-type uncharacterized transport system ATPase subunit
MTSLAGSSALRQSAVARPIKMAAIVKRFGTVVANDHVDFDIRPGEIHALIGQNGAGKSTLMNILFGMLAPDSGQILVDGAQVRLDSPRDALSLGIGMVHQHFTLIDQFSVAQNIVLGSRSSLSGRFNRTAANDEVKRLSSQLGLDVQPDRPCWSLPIDIKQRVEILKLLYRGATTLILDEPTSVLGPTEIAHLFANLRRIRDSGRSIVIITHKLSEVVGVADRVTVMRNGCIVTEVVHGEFDEQRLAIAMIGASLPALRLSAATRTSVSPILVLKDAIVRGSRGNVAIDNLSMAIYGGEIVGIAGVEGNGQQELAEALSGLRRFEAGHFAINGKAAISKNSRDLRRRGVGLITEDRLASDLCLDLSIGENLALSSVALGHYSRYGLLDMRSLGQESQRLTQEYAVSPPDESVLVSKLSGGNQQKVVLARETSAQPLVLIVSQPTRGLDIASAAFVHVKLAALRSAGCAIVLITNDLDELFALADRIMVLYRGKIVYGANTTDVTVQKVAAAMSGLAQSA